LKKDELSIEQSAFEEIEKDFQEVLSEFVGEKSLERFRVEYEKLHRALKKSHENEKRLIRRVKELGAEIVSNAAKVKTALKLSQEDQATISALKREIEKAWKMVDAAHDKEARAKETIMQLKAEITNLSKLVEQGAGISVGQENTVTELLKVKEELTKERDMQVQQIVALRREVSDHVEKVRALESEKVTAEHKIRTLKDMVATKKAESNRELRRKERLERELKELRQAVEKKQEDITSKQAQISKGAEHIAGLERQLRDQRAATEKAEKEYEQLNVRFLKLQQELNEQIQANTQLLAENSEKQVQLQVKQEEIAAIRGDIGKLSRQKDQLAKKHSLLLDSKQDVEAQREQLRGEFGTLEKELEGSRRDADHERKAHDDLIREKELLSKTLRKAQGSTQKQTDLVKVSENAKRNLLQEIAGYKGEAQKQRKIIYSLEQERERYGQEASEAHHKYLQALEEVKIREMTIADLQKKIAEAETKLKQQQNLYEAVRADRNLYSKNLVESQDEIAEMRRKFKIMNHQIEQLKEEIRAKDDALVKEHFDRKKVEKEKEALKHEVQKIRKQIREAEQTIHSQKAEIAKLNHIITEADSERLRQQKEYEVVLSERDILGTQLIRRNDELALLYEKIKIQQSTLAKGEAQYRERLEDIRLLKIKIADLRRELRVLRKSTSSIDTYRQEILRLQKELLGERTKVKALTEELQNPMNVHRWRKLEGSDPSTFDMIQKIQTLQKRLIAKTEEVAEKDMLIEEKEKLYMELKKILARQPGPEALEQLSVYQQSLREKTRQMKAMASELNMYQTQVAEYKFEIERLTREIQDVKKKYFEQRKREQLALQRERRDAAEGQPEFPVVAAAEQPRFTGGGFSLTHPANRGK